MLCVFIVYYWIAEQFDNYKLIFIIKLIEGLSFHAAVNTALSLKLNFNVSC